MSGCKITFRSLGIESGFNSLINASISGKSVDFIVDIF